MSITCKNKNKDVKDAHGCTRHNEAQGGSGGDIGRCSYKRSKSKGSCMLARREEIYEETEHDVCAGAVAQQHRVRDAT